jgi:GTP pyrophosphokinase
LGSGSYSEEAPLSGLRAAGGRLARRVARRLGRPSGSGPSPQLPPELRRVASSHRAAHAKADLEVVRRSYYVAERMHAGQMRRSGDPYITHPLAVAEILADLGVDTTTLVAALLHDTVEDTRYTLEDAQAEFGAEVAALVDGVTKLDKMRFGDAAEAETLRKLIVALAADYRVLVIKIADRLHNMRTLGFQSPVKQQRIARVTLEVLSPLAHRLGVSVVKRELEDRAFEVLHPEDYARIRGLVDDFTAADKRSGTLDGVVRCLHAALSGGKVKAEVSVRTSHYFSIWRRAQERGRQPADINDIVRVLVLVDSVPDCYAALGFAHALWRPVPGRLRDFVATPKFNMYQSLHTTVVDPTGRPVDIQIRTRSMHRLAETGIVARPVGSGADGARLEGLAWLHSLLDWQADAPDPREFLESLSSDLDSDEVLTFTPMGDTLALPSGSTPVDVAYAVHSDVGNHCMGARVNGRLVPLQTRLRSGDVVEILTSDASDAGPSAHWLAFVKTSRARVRIRRELRSKTVAANDPPGAAAGADNVWTQVNETPRPVADEAPDGAGDVAPVGEALVGAALGCEDDAAARVRPDGRAHADGRGHEADGWAGRAEIGADHREVPVRVARCCLPLPGDDVVGFPTHGRAVSLHREGCLNVTAQRPGRDRVAVASWLPPVDATFPAAIAVEAFDRYGLLADITQTLCDSSAAVRSASTTTRRDRVAHARFTVDVAGHDELEALIGAVRKIEGVYDCYRATVATS